LNELSGRTAWQARGFVPHVSPRAERAPSPLPCTALPISARAPETAAEEIPIAAFLLVDQVVCIALTFGGRFLEYNEAERTRTRKQKTLAMEGRINTSDAYHSLSIEGYRVDVDLIERVRDGSWNPDQIEQDRKQRDAMAARGYWLAFQEVKKSVEHILDRQNAGDVAERDHGDWFRALFTPGVEANILAASDLAGYRGDQVYIRNSRHVPPKSDAILDCMTALFDHLRDENNPAVRTVLGHWAFVYIHPYMDGNGRVGRFLMNAMLASGGYPWTVIPVSRRNEYVAALEEASVKNNIKPFAAFLAGLQA
jgi:Fic family protein